MQFLCLPIFLRRQFNWTSRFWLSDPYVSGGSTTRLIVALNTQTCKAVLEARGFHPHFLIILETLLEVGLFMPSPFPGIDPYLEQPSFWSEFHSRLIVAIANAIAPSLRPRYYVSIETRTYLNEADGELLLGPFLRDIRNFGNRFV